MTTMISVGATEGGEAFVAPTDPMDKIDRDRYGRPMVRNAANKKEPYTRCTTFAGVLEDTYNLGRWSNRMVAIGLVDRPDLQLAVAAHRDDKEHLNKICEDAAEAGKAHAAATIGTALHALTEQHDRGQLDLNYVPAAYRNDIQAYIDTTAPLEMVQIETFGVIDELKIAGTWDRIVRVGGRCMIADLKTGSVDYGMGKIAIQLAIYSRCKRYDIKTGTRHKLPDVDQDHALVIHLPAGSGTCRLIDVDIAAGWEAVDLARQVKAWRARKNLSTEFDPSNLALVDAIQTATTVDELERLWEANEGAWTETLTLIAKERKHALQGAA